MKYIFILLFGLSLIGSTGVAVAQLSLVNFQKTNGLGGCSWFKFKEQQFGYFDECQQFEISNLQKTEESDNLKRILISNEKQRLRNKMRNKERQIAMNSWTEVQQYRARLRASCDSKYIFSKVANMEEYTTARKHPEYLECMRSYRAETRQMADWDFIPKTGLWRCRSISTGFIVKKSECDDQRYVDDRWN